VSPVSPLLKELMCSKTTICGTGTTHDVFRHAPYGQESIRIRTTVRLNTNETKCKKKRCTPSDIGLIQESSVSIL
jgi:hypothetical protein